MYEVNGEPDVVLCGCPNGEDFEVQHALDPIVVRSMFGLTWSVGWFEWREAVFAFADRVTAFYEPAAPKCPPQDDVAGLRGFARERERRRGAPGPTAP